MRTHSAIPAHLLRATRAGQRGFTMMELLMAMAVFSMLGLLVVVMMRQGMTVFSRGTRGGLLQDRLASVLPHIERNADLLALPADFEQPPPPPSEEELLAEVPYTPPPPVNVRLRSTFVILRDQPDGPLKGLPCAFAAWVTDISGLRSDPILREAGNRTGPDLKTIEPAELDKANADTMYKPTGGVQEICYIAVPEDPDFPALLTLYFGWRSPVGGEGTLLDERNLDTLKKIQMRCRPVARGVLHFGMLWRRVFAQDWALTSGRIGETEPYVGRVWDSTRALDKKFGLYVDDKSLGDPSDDLFPAWVRVEVSIAAPSALGYGRGETYLMDSVGEDARVIQLTNARVLLGPGAVDRYLKVDGEWMRCRADRVNAATGQVTVERGVRNTIAAPHASGADVYVGLGESRDLRLLFRDRYARTGTRR